MRCDLYVGQKVVCVDADFGAYGSCAHDALPQLGAIYTIREIAPIPLWQVLVNDVDDQPIGVSLVEIDRTAMMDLSRFRGMREAMFRHDRFRPLLERKTDISVFTAMLKDAEEPVPA